MRKTQQSILTLEERKLLSQFMKSRSFKNFYSDSKEYIKWQDKATQFYIASRLLYIKFLYGPYAFCAFQSIENLMKATYGFYKGFSSLKYNHNIKNLQKTINTQIIGKLDQVRVLSIPNYLYFDKRYQIVSRYPTKGKGIGIPENSIDDIDCLFFTLLKLVPFQFNSRLMRIFRASTSEYKLNKVSLVKGNKYSRKVRSLLHNRLIACTAEDTAKIIYKSFRYHKK